MLRTPLVASSLVLFGLLTPLAAPAQTSGDAWDCPAELSSRHAAGPYRFAYQAWSEADDRGALAHHCIRNLSDRALFVDWEEVGVVGFVKPGGTSFSSAARPRDAFAETEATLWYGAAPSELSAPMLRYDDAAPARSAPPKAAAKASEPTDGEPDVFIGKLIGALVEGLAPETGSDAPPAVFSRIKTSVPVAALSDVRSREALVEAVEADPSALRDMTMEFAARVETKGGDRIVYSCAYEIEVAEGESRWTPGRYGLAFDEPALQREMFGFEGPLWVEDGRPAPDAPRPRDGQTVRTEPRPGGFRFSAELEIDAEDVAKLERREAAMLVLSPNGVEAARLPVAYFAVVGD